MVVLTAPAHPETPRMGSPNKSMELAASLKEMKASDTPPARTEDGSVMVVSAGENGHSNGPLSEVSFPNRVASPYGECGAATLHTPDVFPLADKKDVRDSDTGSSTRWILTTVADNPRMKVVQ